MCCGSAGTYSLLEKEMANQLKENKLHYLMLDKPDVIATANVGCQTHLMTQATIPVVHYLELLV
jgi:glycolate oxidase iron-sulfur subunit